MRHAWRTGRLTVALLLVLATVHPSSAAPRACSFRQEVTTGDYLFDVVSRPVIGCSVHVIELKVRHGDAPAVTLKHDSDTYISAAWASDLTGEGVPELILVTRRDGSSAAGSLNAYILADGALRRAPLPPLTGDMGREYQGRDSFRQVGRQIIRTFPVYRQGVPTGASQSLRYELRDGKLVLAAAGNLPPAPAAPADGLPRQPADSPLPGPGPEAAPAADPAPVQVQPAAPLEPAKPPAATPMTAGQDSLPAATTPLAPLRWDPLESTCRHASLSIL